MLARLRIEIYRQDRMVYADEISRPVELGRQQTPREPLFNSQPGESADRLVVAPIEERTVSRRHLLIEPLSFDRLRITNLTAKGTVHLDDVAMAPGATRELETPYQLSVGNYRARFMPALTPTIEIAPLLPDAPAAQHDSLAAPAVDVAALQTQTRLEQFFTPDLTRRLMLEPDLLAGRDAEATLLSGSIRDFSGISERLSAADAVQWINDVFDALLEIVLERQGVLVDFIGGEMVAVWGAPVEQDDHADLACQAAIDIGQAMPEISRRWLDRLGAETCLAIGLHSGQVHVGNVGGQRRFKYGAIGEAVSLCRGVRRAAKHLQTGVVFTSQTCARLGSDFAPRRLCEARMAGGAEPVMLYDVPASPGADWPELCRRYEEALREFEAQRCDRAMSLLRELLNQFPDDGPSLVLLSRVVPLLAAPGPFSPIWGPPGNHTIRGRE